MITPPFFFFSPVFCVEEDRRKSWVLFPLFFFLPVARKGEQTSPSGLLNGGVSFFPASRLPPFLLPPPARFHPPFFPSVASNFLFVFYDKEGEIIAARPFPFFIAPFFLLCWSLMRQGF